MKIRSLVTFAVVVLAASLASRANADTDPLSYDDAGMHYQAPAGWHRIPAPQDSSSPGLDDKKVLAIYTYAPSKTDARIISIVADPFDSGLDAAESSHETDMREESDTALISGKNRTTLANGMPAWFLKATEGDDPFKSSQIYEYVVFDGSRRIVVAYSGHQYGFSEDDAKKALSTLYVVVYPKHRA
jgi:hypothetical protein